MAHEEAQIIETIDAFYALISGPAGHAPDEDAVSSLFCSGASILPCRSADSQKALGVEAYVALLTAALEQRNFYERGLDYRIETKGDIAQVWSRYEASAAATFADIPRQGTNLIHLVRDRGSWRIASMVYQDDA